MGEGASDGVEFDRYRLYVAAFTLDADGIGRRRPQVEPLSKEFAEIAIQFAGFRFASLTHTLG